MPDTVTIGLVSTSDRASGGIYPDEGIPSLKAWLAKAVRNPVRFIEALVPDEQAEIEAALKKMADSDRCDLIFTTGGTGPAPRDVTPEATLNVVEKEMPGFGEQMRQISLYYVPTAILSRQTAGIRGKCLIVNLPGRPKAGGIKVHGLFSAIPYCIDLIGGPFIETDETVSKAFRPQRK